MNYKTVNPLVVSLFRRLIHVRDDEKDSFLDYITLLSDDKDIIKDLSMAYAFACYFYENLESGDMDLKKFPKRDRDYISLFYEAEQLAIGDDEQDEEDEFYSSFDDDSDDDSDDESSEVN